MWELPTTLYQGDGDIRSTAMRALEENADGTPDCKVVLCSSDCLSRAGMIQLTAMSARHFLMCLITAQKCQNSGPLTPRPSEHCCLFI